MRFFGARGDDQFGEFIGGALKDEGVDVTSLAVIAGMHSGVALIAVDAQGENQILALPGANGRAGAPEACGAAVWFCPGEIPRVAHEGTIAAARADGATAIVNPSPANAIDPDVVARFDIAIVNAMSLITKKTRIDAKRVAEIIGCSRKTVLNGGAGTAELTRIRNGSTQIRFILEEVVALAEKQEKQAQRRLPTRTNEQEAHGQRQALSL